VPDLPFLFVAALFALHPVTVSVYPTVSLAQHATFRLTVMAPRHEDNRELCLGYRHPGPLEPWQRRSCQSMDGIHATRTRTVYWDVRMSGEFEAVADLKRIEAGREKHYIDSRPFRVVGIE
jgi:hypothetical protein